MNVVVFGAGSLGSLIGGLLSRKHEVTLVGRDPHVSAVDADGLHVSGEYEFSVEPAAKTTVPDVGDLGVVTVKASDTAEAASALADCTLGSCLSLQNGMGNERTLAERLECPVLAGTCTYGARLVGPGHVECTGTGTVALGPHNGGRSPAAAVAGRVFESAGVETTVDAEMPTRLWEKLAINAAINATTALARIPNGTVVDGPAGAVTTGAARETVRVAQEQGTDLDDGAVLELVSSVASDTARNRSSMLQDVERERRTEIDAINGYVVDQAVEPVPVNETLTRLVRAWECGRGFRSIE